MNERALQNIAQHLSSREAQQRVLQNIHRVRNEAMVTIGQAARLFEFSESQLRDWERIGLLKPVRPAAPPDARSSVKQRQYSFDELDKLALIYELIHYANMTPGHIPSDVNILWEKVRASALASSDDMLPSQPNTYRYITRRAEYIYQNELFWRLYASHALYLSIKLLYEDFPGTYAGLVLPAKALARDVLESDLLPEQLPHRVGEALVGWLAQTRFFSTFLTSAPAFEFPSDFRVVPLRSSWEREQAETLEPRPLSDTTLMVVPRDKLHKWHLDKDTASLVCRLLAPLYENRQNWSTILGQGMKDLVQPGMDRASGAPDIMLNALADMVIHLGGMLPYGETHWHHCCILLPDETYLPLQERRLKVKAVSQGGAKLTDVILYPLEHYNTTVSIRAFLGSHILYRDVLTGADTTEKLARLEGPVRSCIAVPIGGEVAQPVGILYVASYQEQAFSKEDQCLLRLMARMAEEILRSYEVRQHLSRNLSAIMEDPTNTDTLFANFFSEDQLIRDIEALLAGVQEHKWVEAYEEMPTLSQEVSFLAIELNDQDDLHSKYDYLLLRNTYLRVGELIDKHFRSLFSSSGYTKPYHIYGSRYYIFLPGISLADARKEAKRLKKTLDGGYTFTSLYAQAEDIVPLSPAQYLAGIVANVGITSYFYTKLEDMMQRYPGHEAREVRIIVRNVILNALDVTLKRAQRIGGDVIVSWDRDRDEMVSLPAD